MDRLARPKSRRISALLVLALSGSLLASGGSFATTPVKGDAAFGEYLSGTCVTCHQISGRSTGGIPPIVAWPEDQFVAVMNSYRSKDRENQVMRTIAASLSDEEIAALAAYFGGLPLQPDTKK